MGDIVPFVRLAGALVARGHTVTVHAWPQHLAAFPDTVARVAAAGTVGQDEADRAARAALSASSMLDEIRAWARLFYGLGDGPERARAYHAGAVAAFAGHDVAVLHALDHVGHAAADRIGLPWLSYTSRPPPDLAQADAAFAPVDEALSALIREATGAARRVRTFREASSRLVLAACSPLLVGHGGPGVAVTGAWFGHEAEPPLPAPVAAFASAAPTLAVTFGTMPDVRGRTALLARAIVDAGWRAVLQVLDGAPVPDHPALCVVRGRVPFSQLFPLAAAVVHHGSVGTAHEVLRAGRPALVVSHMGDQAYWARVLHHAGVAAPPIAAAQLAAAPLAASLDALRDPALARRAAQLASPIGAEDGVRAAVAAIGAVA